MTSLTVEKEGYAGRLLAIFRSIPLFKINGAFGSSYFALFSPLQDLQSRLILACGIVLAIAAGAPLPIIGVIFARIINSFPPSEDEVVTRISELVGVGTQLAPFHVACLDIHSCCIFCYYLGMVRLLGDSWRSNIERTPYSDG